jgi:hypothetical protein
MIKLAKPIASFDFNNTFNTFKGKGLALQLINQGFDIIIVSQLGENNRTLVENTAKRAGIPVKNIYFTNNQDKYRTLAGIAGVRRHYDNNQEQVDKINRFAPFIKGIKF